MFTNWLTNSVPTAAATASGATVATPVVAGRSGTASNNRSLEETAFPLSSGPAMTTHSTSTSTNLMSTPPDIILEVGPAPGVRFVAHSIVLGMHSGYLRSAIRLDERVATAAATHATELVLYLSNVTPDQFAPLLTYMYTGYLDVNVENIFAVLLATHVLHMPRALEICRSFLGRAQSDGYLGTAALPSLSSSSSSANSGKVIRPIPSKAALPNYGFIAPPLVHHLALPPPPPPPLPPPPAQASYLPPPASTQTLQSVASNAVTVTTERQETNNNAADGDDDDDEEVFIESNDNSLASPEIDCNISVTSSKDVDVEKDVLLDVVDAAEEPVKAAPPKRSDVATTPKQPSARSLAKREKLRQSRSNKQSRRQKSPAGGLQIAKAPILASELDAERAVSAVVAVAEREKVIIDVASCDGPVRFRRILNTAYGHKPQEGSAAFSNGLPAERSQQSVSLSFHQQMAKTISQQRQLQHAEESENSESSGSGGGGGSGSGGRAGAATGTSKSGNKVPVNEVFVCVYCKHSFKSQYCYQKHAKRHLNPLSLSCGNATDPGCSAANRSEDVVCEAVSGRRQSAGSRVQTGGGAEVGAAAAPSRLPAAAAAELLRREVRPLDMNVQYYPCKTCGSKFPSYYFVHKHRKLCHAEEEAQEAESRRSGAAPSGGSSAGAHQKLV